MGEALNETGQKNERPGRVPTFVAPKRAACQFFRGQAAR
jgi:hypothetical protein